MYSICDYGDMILDRGRTEAYAQAIRARVNSDSVVLDLGAGPGILTLFACQAGARKVYAVEPDGVIETAREAVIASGFADRVEFYQALSTDIGLPEKVNVIVGDLHGILPLFHGSLTSFIDARDRFLEPGGFIIPERETLLVAVVTAPEFYKRNEGPWRSNSGLDFEGALRRAVNTWGGRRFPPQALLVEPKVWMVLDYGQLQTPNAKGGAQWTIAQACEAHGLAIWFDSITAPGCGFSNSPASGEEHIFRQGFFPWPEACRLDPGDTVAVELRADRVGPDYNWSWNTEIRGSDRQQPVKKLFRQSGFLAAPISRDWMRKAAGGFVPSPNMEAAIDRMILELFHSSISLEAISRKVADRFPQRFPEWRKALTRVGEMSLKYSQ